VTTATVEARRGESVMPAQYYKGRDVRQHTTSLDRFADPDR
jgi:hypothetical protein